MRQFALVLIAAVALWPAAGGAGLPGQAEPQLRRQWRVLRRVVRPGLVSDDPCQAGRRSADRRGRRQRSGSGKGDGREGGVDSSHP